MFILQLFVLLLLDFYSCYRYKHLFYSFLTKVFLRFVEYRNKLLFVLFLFTHQRKMLFPSPAYLSYCMEKLFLYHFFLAILSYLIFVLHNLNNVKFLSALYLFYHIFTLFFFWYFFCLTFTWLLLFFVSLFYSSDNSNIWYAYIFSFCVFIFFNDRITLNEKNCIEITMPKEFII